MIASMMRAIAPLERSRPVLFTLFHHVEPTVLGMSFKRQLNSVVLHQLGNRLVGTVPGK